MKPPRTKKQPQPYLPIEDILDAEQEYLEQTNAEKDDQQSHLDYLRDAKEE